MSEPRLHRYWCRTCGPTACFPLTSECCTCKRPIASTFFTAEMESERLALGGPVMKPEMIRDDLEGLERVLTETVRALQVLAMQLPKETR